MSIALRDADVMELNIADLTPFTNYTVFVEASTVDYGEMSDEVTVVTLEDGKESVCWYDKICWKGLRVGGMQI